MTFIRYGDIITLTDIDGYSLGKWNYTDALRSEQKDTSSVSSWSGPMMLQILNGNNRADRGRIPAFSKKEDSVVIVPVESPGYFIGDRVGVAIQWVTDESRNKWYLSAWTNNQWISHTDKIMLELKAADRPGYILGARFQHPYNIYNTYYQYSIGAGSTPGVNPASLISLSMAGGHPFVIRSQIGVMEQLCVTGKSRDAECYSSPIYSWYDSVVNTIRKDDEARPQILNTIQQSPGRFDTIMANLCAANMNLDICSCYQQMPADTPAELRVLNSKPQCWNVNCNMKGYKTINLASDQSTCSPVTICTQNINQMNNTSTLNMDNIIKQDCSSTTNTTTGAGPTTSVTAPPVNQTTNRTGDGSGSTVDNSPIRPNNTITNKPPSTGTVNIGGYDIPILLIIVAFALVIILAMKLNSAPEMPMPNYGMPMPMMPMQNYGY